MVDERRVGGGGGGGRGYERGRCRLDNDISFVGGFVREEPLTLASTDRVLITSSFLSDSRN